MGIYTTLLTGAAYGQAQKPGQGMHGSNIVCAKNGLPVGDASWRIST